MKIPEKLKSRLRLFSIYSQLGYIPWKKPAQPRKERKKKKEGGVYMGAREAIIPFLNEDGKRTFSHLLLRPGYMMRDYILRGAHEHYLAPLTALLVFYSVFTLLLAIVKPDTGRDNLGDNVRNSIREIVVEQEDSTRSERTEKMVSATNVLLQTVSDAVILTRLDKYPEEANTPWKQSLAAFERELRSKGFYLFLDSFLFLWLAMAIVLRKKGIRMSGAAAASAYVLCQYCIFMFLALILTWGKTAELSTLFMGILLFIDYRQMLGLKNKESFWLTVKTGLYIVLFEFGLIFALVLVLAGIALVQLI
ncbi:MAG: DUF3667 domain-containing protein [Bacteroidales bacterium]|nr:DUF3667 domain-containing protein [Bacteroidales bacterium]